MPDNPSLLGQVPEEAIKYHDDPVITAIELRSDGEIKDYTVVTSAYEKDLDYLISNSDILYLDPNKKRTDNWLQQLGLQLPSLVTQYGSIGKITYYDEKNNPFGKDNSLAVFIRLKQRRKKECLFLVQGICSLMTKTEECKSQILMH